MNARARMTALRPYLSAMGRHIVGVLVGVLSIPLIARTLGANALAVWTLLGTGSFVLGCSDLGLSTAVMRSARDESNPSRTRDVLQLAMKSIALIAPLAALVIGWTMPSFESYGTAFQRDATRAMVLFLLGGVLSAATFPPRAFLLVRGGIQALASARVAGAVAQLVVMGLALAVHPSLTTAALGPLVGNGLEAFLTMRGARLMDRHLAWNPWSRTSLTRSEIWTAFREGSGALVLNLSVLLALRADVFVLARVGTLGVVASYAVGSRAVDQSFMLAKQVSTALLPRLASELRARATLSKGTIVVSSLVGAGMTALALNGSALLRAWAGRAASEPILSQTLLVLGIAACLASFHEIATAWLSLSSGSNWKATWPELQGALLNIVVTVGFARTLGVLAVAGGTVLGNLWITFQIWRTTLKEQQMHIRELLPIAAVPLAAILGAGAVGWALRSVALESAIGSLFASCISALVGLLVAVAVWRTSRDATTTSNRNGDQHAWISGRSGAPR